jgi:hypothetical protein
LNICWLASKTAVPCVYYPAHKREGFFQVYDVRKLLNRKSNITIVWGLKKIKLTEILPMISLQQANKGYSKINLRLAGKKK